MSKSETFAEAKRVYLKAKRVFTYAMEETEGEEEVPLEAYNVFSAACKAWREANAEYDS